MRDDESSHAFSTGIGANKDLFMVPRKEESVGWMYKLWDETKHMTHKKLAGFRGGKKGETQMMENHRVDDWLSSDDGTASSSSLSVSSPFDLSATAMKQHLNIASKYNADGRDPENDDSDFEKEIRSRPKEIDDEEDDEDIEVADDKQQRLFDEEVVKDAMSKRAWFLW